MEVEKIMLDEELTVSSLRRILFGLDPKFDDFEISVPMPDVICEMSVFRVTHIDIGIGLKSDESEDIGIVLLS